jgi:hypothetical protein
MGITHWGTLAILGTAATLGTAGQGGQQPQQRSPKLDVAKVTAQLGVAGDTKTAVTTDLNRLNELLVQRATAGNQLGQVSRNLGEVFQDLATRLTPEQRATLRQALWDANGSAGWGGHMGYMMGGPGSAGGCWGNGAMGYGMMGNPMMGRGMGGNGTSWGGHMGGGHLGSRGPGGPR